MREYYDDIRDKKRIAASARHRKCGSKTRYVSLPSDGMTQAEWKRRNGPMATYNLKTPMTLDQLKTMPDDLQREYIEGLRRDYKANKKCLAGMLGVHEITASKTFTSLGIVFSRGGGGKMTAEEREKWQAFLEGREQSDEEPVEIVSEEVPCEAQKKAERARLTSGMMSFVGSAGDAMRQVYELLGESCVRMTIHWEPVEEVEE